MSSLGKPNRDDFPDAAEKHLADAQALADAERYDGAGYLAGYVVECALKTLLEVEGAPGWGHSLVDLGKDVGAVCALAGARTARYLTPSVRAVPVAAIAGWSATMRYHSPSMSAGDAQAWLDEANTIYQDTVASMILDGVI